MGSVNAEQSREHFILLKHNPCIIKYNASVFDNFMNRQSGLLNFCNVKGSKIHIYSLKMQSAKPPILILRKKLLLKNSIDQLI